MCVRGHRAKGVGRHCVPASFTKLFTKKRIADNRGVNAPHAKRLRRLEEIYGKRRPIFFVTMCTANRRAILDRDEVHTAFRQFCERSPSIAQVWVGHYVLMPDHLHVLISADGSHTLSRWVGSLKKFLVVVLRHSGFSPPYWQASFFDHLVRSSEKYRSVWEYIRLNPTHAEQSMPPPDWPYSGEIHVLRWDSHEV